MKKKLRLRKEIVEGIVELNFINLLIVVFTRSYTIFIPVMIIYIISLNVLLLFGGFESVK